MLICSSSVEGRTHCSLIIRRSFITTRFSEHWAKELNAHTLRIQNANLRFWNAKSLWNAYKKFSYLQARQYAVGVLLPLLDNHGISHLENFLKTFLHSRLSPKKSAYAFMVFTTPIKNSFAQDQEIALLRLYDKAFANRKVRNLLNRENAQSVITQLRKSHPRIVQQLERHIRRFGWVYYVYEGPPLSFLQCIEFLQEYAHRGVQPLQELKKRKLARDTMRKARSTLLRQLKPTPKEKMLLSIAADYVWAKPRRKDYQSKSYFHMESFFLEWARRTSTSLHHARSATQAQLRDGLYGKHISLNKLERQFQHHLVFPASTPPAILVGASADAFEKMHIPMENDWSQQKHGNVVHGTMAYPGIILGKVRIVNSLEDVQAMRQCEILVSVATSPSLVSAMRKAAAIVSDEGGLTCHAAIVSRELCIPCIVGTKVATKTFKNGDFVKVNAEHGIVRKLKT